MHAMECIVNYDKRTEEALVTFQSIFQTDVAGFAILCSALPIDKTNMPISQVKNLRDWLNKIITNYEATDHLCIYCLNRLPRTAVLDERNFWIVTCNNCSFKHTIGIK